VGNDRALDGRRALWKPWPKDSELPEFKSIILSFHLPFDGAETFDESACSVWGIFRSRFKGDYGIGQELNNAMMLFAWSGEYTLAEFADKAGPLMTPIITGPMEVLSGLSRMWRDPQYSPGNYRDLMSGFRSGLPSRDPKGPTDMRNALMRPL